MLSDELTPSLTQTQDGTEAHTALLPYSVRVLQLAL